MKKKIALATGGYSGESVISYKSATTIFNHLDKDRFDVFLIDITPNGWIYTDNEGNKIPVNKNNFSLNIKNKELQFDLVFIGMHGTPGEDGKLQGYFDMLGLKYTSCNAATSALTFNKRYTVAVASMAGIGVAPSVHLFKNIFYDVDSISKKLKLPYFVKPNNGGSSIGMSKVSKQEDLEAAIQKAFKEDDQVLIEEMISGREFTIGVFRANNKIEVLPITEVITHNEFFDYEAKYEGKSTEITPAKIDDSWKTNLEETARKAYSIFNCRGVVRIDFIYNEKENKPYMLEINTIPGQSEASVVPQQVRAKGWNLTEFYSKLVDDALENK